MPWCQGRRWTSLEGGNRGLRSEAGAVLWGFDGGWRGAQGVSEDSAARVLAEAEAMQVRGV
jgi:hypothetical protein